MNVPWRCTSVRKPARPHDHACGRCTECAIAIALEAGYLLVSSKVDERVAANRIGAHVPVQAIRVDALTGALGPSAYNGAWFILQKEIVRAPRYYNTSPDQRERAVERTFNELVGHFVTRKLTADVDPADYEPRPGRLRFNHFYLIDRHVRFYLKRRSLDVVEKDAKRDEIETSWDAGDAAAVGNGDSTPSGLDETWQPRAGADAPVVDDVLAREARASLRAGAARIDRWAVKLPDSQRAVIQIARDHRVGALLSDWEIGQMLGKSPSNVGTVRNSCKEFALILCDDDSSPPGAGTASLFVLLAHLLRGDRIEQIEHTLLERHLGRLLGWLATLDAEDARGVEAAMGSLPDAWRTKAMRAIRGQGLGLNIVETDRDDEQVVRFAAALTETGRSIRRHANDFQLAMIELLDGG